MAGKKKKPATNPARGFATTSIQSKAKLETVNTTDSAEQSSVATPSTAPRSAPTEISQNGTSDISRALHELSPEELEAQLHQSELQQFVETYAAKVRKDSSRQVARLQTDKRVLRGQADYLSVSGWLPEELMLQLWDLVTADIDDRNDAKTPSLPTGDDLVSKIWTLRVCLVGLDFSLDRIDRIIRGLLQVPPSSDTNGQIWGLADALERLALSCSSEELVEYDSHSSLRAVPSVDDSDDEINMNPRKATTDSHANSMISSREGTQNESNVDDTIGLSDLESDPEPDELVAAYIRILSRLYNIDPALADSLSKKKGLGQPPEVNGDHRSQSASVKRLKQNLAKIVSDVLFDDRDAEAQWNAKKINLVREAAERHRLQLSHKSGAEVEDRVSEVISNNNWSNVVSEEAGQLGMEILEENEGSDDDDLLSGMFNAHPGVPQSATESQSSELKHPVVVRSFGHMTGIHPKRILEETCRSRDSKCKVTYQQVSPTAYSCRHALNIQWTKPQDIQESSFLPSVTVRCKPRLLTLTMMYEATPEVTQSEAYVATLALFMIFSDSPKEEKSHLRLPPAFRDLWDECAKAKSEKIDSEDRETVGQMRRLVEEERRIGNDSDADEVIFNANLRRLNGAASGRTTPVSRPLTPRFDDPLAPQMLKDIWDRKVATASYQQMLGERMKLPMFHAKDDALETIARNQVTIVVGDTGSGKSTQLPQFLLEHELSRGHQCKIYCTEPRRISALSLAHRVSEELGEHKGDLGTSHSLVGYAIRLESQSVAQTKLIYATVGIVLRMLESNDGLKEVTHLVLDEVHERSIDTDFLLIILRSLMTTRPDLKVILMSATMDAQKFSSYLDGAPIISVPGRTFPVEALFLEDAIELTGHVLEDTNISNGDADDIDSDQGETTSPTQSLKERGYSVGTVKTLAQYDEYRIDDGLIVKLTERVANHPQYQRFSAAILIFLPGIAEIRRLTDMFLGHRSFSRGWRIHALHSTFSSEEQQAAFATPPNGIRKIVLATNIAETGITIPDVTCVIDTGKHREMRFDERRQMSRLLQSFIARANAKQRRGRAGRVQEGICFHLFTKHRFEELMMEQQTPEMLRLSLQDLVMRVKICKLGDIEDTLLQALDPPSSRNIRRAIDALTEVGALTDNEQLTPLGSQLAKLPLDAQLGKLILLGATFGCLDTTLTIAAALSSKSPFLSPMHARKQADSVRLGFKRGDSDLLTLYNAYSSWRKICTTQGVSEYHFCNKNFLSPQNLSNIEDLKAQLLGSLLDAGIVHAGPAEKSALAKMRPGSRQRHFVAIPEKYTRNDDKDLVALSVIAWSFYPKIVKQDGKGWRNIANNQSLGLHPTSVNKHSLAADTKYMSFYSIMQSSSKFTNAQETSPVTDFALVVLAGEAVFHLYAGVIVIDGNRLRLKVKDWRTMIMLKTLRAKVREAVGRVFRHAGRLLAHRQMAWMEILERIFEKKKA